MHALRWAERAHPVLVADDELALTEAEDVLLDIRVALHRLTHRPTDELALELQDDVAGALGLADADAVMAHVSAAARTVGWVSDEAKAICGLCPVREPCLEHALVVREKLGVWGGLTERERRRVLRRRRRSA